MIADNAMKRISFTLNRDSLHKYYVYMLLDENKVPFYIGKGQGGRVFQHEYDADDFLEIIRNEREDISGVYDNLSDKIKHILENAGKIEKVIIKWGLTENEAFMCESALMNMYDYINPDVLTNIVNGHASDLEKYSRHIDGSATRARSVDSFIQNVAIEEICFKDYCKDIPVVFITNNVSFVKLDKEKNDPKFTADKYFYDSVRGFWKLSRNKVEKARFVIALSQQIVTGVYPVSSDRWFTMADYPTEDFPIFPKYYRIDDKNASGTDKTYQEYVSLGGTDKEEAFNKRRNRIGFVKADHYDADEYQLLSKLVGTYLTDDYLKNQTSPYNFRVDSKGQLHFYDFASWVKDKK